tara:strand:- start:11 stop:310 length:300 start_codon:yes stop_codon:yes gene_type:complete
MNKSRAERELVTLGIGWAHSPTTESKIERNKAMNEFKVGDKVKLMTSHYLFNDWAIGKSGVVKTSIVNWKYRTYMIEIENRSLWVESHDLRLEEHNVEL